MAGEDATAELPPRPDPETGEPQPPEAPAQNPEGYNERKPSRLPAPPKRHGPVLAYYRASRAAVWLTAPVLVAVILIALVLHSGFIALTYWPIWLLLGAYFVFTVYSGRAEVVTAGADWVMKFGRHWVNTYELTSIQYKSRGANGFELVLIDGDRKVSLKPYLVQANRKLWNYVYLGMRHSAANGAEVDRAARSFFPELGEAASRRSTGMRISGRTDDES